MIKIEGNSKVTFWHGFLLLIDILANLLTGGMYGSTISSRVGKGVLYGKWQYTAILRPVIDYIFNSRIVPKKWRFPDHCQHAIKWSSGLTKAQVCEKVMEIRKVDLNAATHITKTKGLKSWGYVGPIDLHKTILPPPWRKS